MRQLDELHVEYPFAGSRILRGLLRQEGHEVGHLHVATLMKRMGIAALYRRPATSHPTPGHQLDPYLLREAGRHPTEPSLGDGCLIRGHSLPDLQCDRRLSTGNRWPSRSDTSLTSRRLTRILERLRLERGLPQRLRVDNGPEFLSAAFVAWADSAGLAIQYIPKGEPNQNAYIERFNRIYREEVLNLYLFRNLAEVRETTHGWRIDYNEHRPHDALEGRTPAECINQNAKNSSLELSP